MDEHRSMILTCESDNNDNIINFRVRRKHIWKDALNKFQRGFDVSKQIQVTFLGEPAVDAGGPLREFFRLLLSEIAANGTLFYGAENARLPCHNTCWNWQETLTST